MFKIHYPLKEKIFTNVFDTSQTFTHIFSIEDPKEEFSLLFLQETKNKAWFLSWGERITIRSFRSGHSSGYIHYLKEEFSNLLKTQVPFSKEKAEVFTTLLILKGLGVYDWAKLADMRSGKKRRIEIQKKPRRGIPK